MTLAEVITPVDTDEVYHITSMRLIDIVLREGLRANPGRGITGGWRRMEQFLDEVRPEQIKSMGISRKEGIFAHPDIEPMQFSGSMGLWGATKMGETAVALAVAVRPSEALVCDAFDLGQLVGSLANCNETLSQEIAERYWSRSITLKHFRDYYDTQVGDFGISHTRRDTAPEDVPYRFLEPEVIVPAPINAAQLSWAASSLIVKPQLR